MTWREVEKNMKGKPVGGREGGKLMCLLGKETGGTEQVKGKMW